MIIEVGKQIRDYRIISLLGSGGMGEVWLAEDVIIQRKLAIKVLSPQMAADTGLVERFRREAQLQANLHHPNILGILSFFSHEDTYLLCMEYAEGGTLKELISRVGPIPYQRSINIILQALRVLAFIHSNNIIHRDIKPSNIMINPEDSDSIKIMDFGIAKAVSGEHQTQTGTVLGSVYYMSPEQILRGNRVDSRTDLFSLGITFFEMLCGKLPYDTTTDSDYKVQKEIIEQVLPDPRLHYPHIPDWILLILNKMCEKNENNRYQKATEIITDIENGNRLFFGNQAETVVSPSLPSSSNSITNQQVMPEQAETTADTADGEEVNIEPQAQIKKSHRWLYLLIIGAVLTGSALLALRHYKINGKEQGTATRTQEKVGKEPLSSPQALSGNMVVVEAGSFDMGHPTTIFQDERPVHRVSINRFYLSKYELTVSEFMEVMGYNPSSYTQGDFPVSSVTWFQAIEYCNRRSMKESLSPVYSLDGKANPDTWTSGNIAANFSANGYRLPTEAEWEYAARGGKLNSTDNFSGSQDLAKVGWYLDNPKIPALQVDRYDLYPHPVGQKEPNALGIYDMCGNVWEWVWDSYDKTYYSNSPAENPTGPGGEKTKLVLRGGAYDSERGFCFVSTRGFRPPNTIHRTYGFRVCRSNP